MYVGIVVPQGRAEHVFDESSVHDVDRGGPRLHENSVEQSCAVYADEHVSLRHQDRLLLEGKPIKWKCMVQ